MSPQPGGRPGRRWPRMTLFSRIFTGLGAFLIVMGIVYALVTKEYEGAPRCSPWLAVAS